MLRYILRFPRRFLKKGLFPVLNRINFYAEGVQCSSFPIVNGLLHIRNEGAISLGNGVIINSGIAHNPVGGDAQAWLWTNQTGRITIGNNAAISNASFVSFASVEIGDDVFIGGGCKIYDTDFHPLALDQRRVGSTEQGKVRSKPVCIRRGAFIGAHSIILKGVTVGEEAIIGAGSVVTQNVPDREIWGGNPARFIRNLES